MTTKKEYYADPDNKPKVLVPEMAGIPEALKAVIRWVCWMMPWVTKSDGTGYWSKVPYQTNGRKAMPNNPATWMTFAEVEAAYARGGYDGIGFMLGDGFAGIDLDNCRDPETGEFSPWARAILDACGTYAEVSPSGTGAKIFGRGVWKGDWHKRKTESGGEIEIYDSGRYFAITGHRLNERGVEDISSYLDTLVDYCKVEKSPPRAPRVRTPKAPQSPVPELPSSPLPPLNAEDTELVARASAAENGEKFSLLFAGDTSGYGGDHSSADLALCNLLAYWVGQDTERMHRIFRSSKLMRPKWDEARTSDGSTYGQMTIAKALEGRTEFHESASRCEAGAGGGHCTASPRFEFIPHMVFMSKNFKPTWLVKHVLVKDQPGVIGGPSKMLKTSIAADLVISLASGTPFLGKFEIARTHKVAIASGESGGSTLQTTAERICAARGIDMSAIEDRLHWCLDLPILSEPVQVREFASQLVALEVELVVLDPLYLMLGDVDPKNMFEMGEVLRCVAKIFIAQGITPIFIHHANKQLRVGEDMELVHLSHAGCEQFMRQYILLNRSEKYSQPGSHRFKMRIGGSAGHQGAYRLDIEEGSLNDDFGGRVWEVAVSQWEIDAAGEVDRDAEKAKKYQAKIATETEGLLRGIDAVVAGGQPAATKSQLKEVLHYSEARITMLIEGQLMKGTLEEHVWKKQMGKTARREVTGYRRAEGGNPQE